MEAARATRLTARKVTRHVTSARSYSTVHDIPRAAAIVGQTPPPPRPTPTRASVFDDALNAKAARNTWTREEISEIHQRPLMELAFAAVRPLTPQYKSHAYVKTRLKYTVDSINPLPSSYAH